MLCGDTVWRRGPLGHGHVWALQGRAVAAGPAVAARGAQPRYFQPGLPPAGPAGVRGRIPPVHGRASPNPTDWNCAVWWRWMAKPCAGPSVAASTPLHMVNVWAAGRECAWLSASSRPQRGSGGVGSPRPRSTSKAVSLPRMHCTAIATLPPRCSSGVRMTCWRSRRTRAVVRCGRSALCAQRSPQRCRTARTRHSRSLRVAARDRTIPLSPRSRSSRRRCAGPHRLAPPRARCLYETSPGALLPALQLYSRQATAAHRALPLGDREPAASGTRCRLQRGSQPNSRKRQRAREPWLSFRKLALNSVRSRPSATSCARKSNARGGTTPSSWACSVICDSPAHKGEGNTPSAPKGSRATPTPRARAPSVGGSPACPARCR